MPHVTIKGRCVAAALGLLITTAASAQNAGINYDSDDDFNLGLGRNCPILQDAGFVVDPITPTPIRLPVVNAENAEVSIFQYPSGGDVVYSGPTKLDYLFVPDASFDGRATVRFRVTPRDDCNGATLIGSIELLSGLAPVPGALYGNPHNHLRACGIGASHVLMMASAGAMLVFAVQRRQPRRRA